MQETGKEQLRAAHSREGKDEWRSKKKANVLNDWVASVVNAHPCFLLSHHDVMAKKETFAKVLAPMIWLSAIYVSALAILLQVSKRQEGSDDVRDYCFDHQGAYLLKKI